MAITAPPLRPEPYRLKQGTVGLPFHVVLRSSDGQPIDLSDIQHIWFLMRRRGETVPTVNAEAIKLQTGTAEDGDRLGEAEYTWQPGDTDSPGCFYDEWRLTDSNGATYWVPNDGFGVIRIGPNLGPPPG